MNSYEYIWTFIDRSDPEKCWIWPRSAESDGYGTVRINRKLYKVHRVAFFLANGYFPEWPRQVTHSCDTPRCCNPAHLFDKTAKENCREAWDRGRCKGKGKGAYVHVSVDQDRLIIVELLKNHTYKDVARAYGCSIGTIQRVEASV